MKHSWRYALTSVFVLTPFIAVGCGDDARDFSGDNGDASAGSGGDGGESGSGGDGASGGDGGTSGSGGDATGGDGGDATGGDGGTGEDGGPSGGADAGTDASMDGGGDSGPTDCSSDDDCDDGIVCNGQETCEDGVCEDGTQLANGTTCKQKFIPVDGGVTDAGSASDDGGASVETVCYNGACSPTCDTDDECDDGDPCTGSEICLSDAKVCISGTPLDCSDDSDCTEDICEPGVGCANPIIDGDGDGHADESLGECGDDCDDSDPEVFTGAGELCDEKDNDCDDEIDENAPVWYRDCDLDGYAPAGAASIQQCDAPAEAHASCGAAGGGWTALEPVDQASRDCWDFHPEAKPGHSEWKDETIETSGMSPPLDADWNCDGVEELLYTAVGDSSNSCLQLCPIGGPCGGCFGLQSGWHSSVPTCGATRTYYSCDRNCSAQTGSRTQQCR